MKIKHISLLVLSAAGFLASCGNSTKDQKYINDVNSALRDFIGEINTCDDAVQIAKTAGFDLENYKLGNENACFTFDINSKQFIVMEGDNVVAAPSGYKKNKDTYALFKFTNAYDASSVYSQYLTSDFKGADLLVVTTGLDMGSNWNVKSLIYNNTSGIEKNIVLNTFSDYLTITAPTDNITHYGDANNVFVVAMNEDKEFHAYGTYAYMQPSAGNIYLEPGSSTDLFEIKDGSTAVVYEERGASVEAAIDVPEIPTTKDIKYVEVDDYTQLTSDTPMKNTTTFFRLTSDVAFPDITNDSNNTNVWIVKNSFFLDLNGHKISFTGNSCYDADKNESSIYEGKSGAINDKYHIGILIDAELQGKDLESYIIDTQATLYERPSIELNDCTIIVAGSEDYSARLNITSGRISDVRGVAHDFGTASEKPTYTYNNPSILVMGNTEDNNPDRKAFNSSFYMYGGYIRNSEGPKFYTYPSEGDYDSAVAFKCIQPRGKGSVVEMSYGDLYSRGYCISGQGTPNFDRFGDTVISISGGTLVGGLGGYLDDRYTPLFFPQGGDLSITGGNITGPTCLDVKSGNININGGTFTATREFKEIHSGINGSYADGSVILIEPNNHYAGGDINLVVENATMTSKHGYITNVLHNTAEGGDKKANVIHNGGTYYYAKEGSNKSTHIDDELVTAGLVTLDVNGGTWIQANR